jgi:hypothetical protein
LNHPVEDDLLFLIKIKVKKSQAFSYSLVNMVSNARNKLSLTMLNNTQQKKQTYDTIQLALLNKCLLHTKVHV